MFQVEGCHYTVSPKCIHMEETNQPTEFLMGITMAATKIVHGVLQVWKLRCQNHGKWETVQKTHSIWQQPWFQRHVSNPGSMLPPKDPSGSWETLKQLLGHPKSSSYEESVRAPYVRMQNGIPFRHCVACGTSLLLTSRKTIILTEASLQVFLSHLITATNNA